MLDFHVNNKTCTSCGLCVVDCPAAIIKLDGNMPVIAAEDEVKCYQCQHCLAVCPTGAVSILGVDPAATTSLAGKFPLPDAMEALIKGRRTVRFYKDEDLDPALIDRLLDVTGHAPTGKNARQVRLTVIDTRKAMHLFRAKMMAALRKAVDAGRILPERAAFSYIVERWESAGLDIVFRGAPHLLVASAPRTCPTPEADCFIALSYFELMAQSLGLGTVWAGLVTWAINGIAPELRGDLRIPGDHVLVYAMMFGRPAVKYQRTVQRKPAVIDRIRPATL
jgi:nitroreductase/NAD-dependent dihydropyrimidine dehydrogenase PreA subunit